MTELTAGGVSVHRDSAGVLRESIEVAIDNGQLSPSGTAPVTSTFTTTGFGDPFTPIPGRPFNASLYGTFVATLRLARSFDNGVTFLPLTALGTPITFTGPCTETFEEYEDGVLYRWECTSFTSGTINYRISQ